MNAAAGRAPESSERGDEVPAELQRSGPLRSEVELDTITAFISILANGLALGISLGLQIDVDARLLVHTGIDAQ